jgi:hypothetical protein
MFEKYISMDAVLPHEASWARKYLQNKERKDQIEKSLNDLKNEQKLVLLSEQLVEALDNLDNSSKQALLEFFSTSLQCDPEERAVDLFQAFGHFIGKE